MKGHDCVIYALADPRKRGVKRVFYIGKALEAQVRLKTHIKQAKRSIRKTRKEVKILELVELGIGPHLMILEFVDDCKGWQDRERWWIDEYKRRGAVLLNIAPGGGGGPPMRLFVRRHIARLLRGRKLTDEHKANIGKANKGKVVSQEARRNMSKARKGKKFSLQARKNMSDGVKKKWQDEPYRKKFSKSRKGLTPWNKGLRGIKQKGE